MSPVRLQFQQAPDRLRVNLDPARYEVFEPARARSLVRRIEFCHTPKHGNWLNVAEGAPCKLKSVYPDIKI